MKPYGYVCQLQWTDCSGCISLIISLVGVGLFLASVVCIPCIHPSHITKDVYPWAGGWRCGWRCDHQQLLSGWWWLACCWARGLSIARICGQAPPFLVSTSTALWQIYHPQSSTSTCMWCLYDIYIYMTYMEYLWISTNGILFGDFGSTTPEGRWGRHVLCRPSEVGRLWAYRGVQRGAVPATLPGGARVLAFHLLAGSWDHYFCTTELAARFSWVTGVSWFRNVTYPFQVLWPQSRE